MNVLQKKADVIEQVLSYLIQETKNVQNPPSEYAMYIDPVISDTWLLVVYFPAMKKLRQALKSGLCYNMHIFLKQMLEVQEPLKDESFHIIFDHGKRPEKEQLVVAYFGEKYRQLEALASKAGKNSEICAHCGHLMKDHQMSGFPNKETGRLEEGWIICPDENCTCFHTWSVGKDAVRTE